MLTKIKYLLIPLLFLSLFTNAQIKNEITSFEIEKRESLKASLYHNNSLYYVSINNKPNKSTKKDYIINLIKIDSKGNVTKKDITPDFPKTKTLYSKIDVITIKNEFIILITNNTSATTNTCSLLKISTDGKTQFSNILTDYKAPKGYSSIYRKNYIRMTKSPDNNLLSIAFATTEKNTMLWIIKTSDLSIIENSTIKISFKNSEKEYTKDDYKSIMSMTMNNNGNIGLSFLNHRIFHSKGKNSFSYNYSPDYNKYRTLISTSFCKNNKIYFFDQWYSYSFNNNIPSKFILSDSHFKILDHKEFDIKTILHFNNAFSHSKAETFITASQYVQGSSTSMYGTIEIFSIKNNKISKFEKIDRKVSGLNASILNKSRILKINGTNYLTFSSLPKRTGVMNGANTKESLFIQDISKMYSEPILFPNEFKKGYFNHNLSLVMNSKIYITLIDQDVVHIYSIKMN